LVAYVRWEEALLPKGRIGNAPPLARRAFLLGEAIPGVSLSVLEGETAHLSAAEVAGSDWLPGTINKVFGSRDAHVIAAKELEGARLGLHPHLLTVEGGAIWNPHFPLQRRYFEVQGDTVIGGAIASPDWHWVQQWWRRELGQSQPWPGERLAEALMSHLLGIVEVVDPSGFAALRGRPVLYLANHETYLESVFFTITMAALSDIQVAALAKVEHQSLWLGQLHDAITQWPGVPHPGAIVYFDQADPASLPRILSAQLHERSLLVHVEGTRQVQPGAAIEKISSMWVDLCMDRQIPIVPVAFRGGIVDAKTDVPVGGARQSVHIGPAILPETLAALPYAERRRLIAQQIDCLGQPAMAAQPQALLVERMAHSAAKGPVLALLQAVCADTSLITEAERALLPTWGQDLLV
jgi:1-acyl-sn-glycerol-3-phosphate acyltransferase